MATLIELDDKVVQRQLQALQSRGQALRPALEEIGEAWVVSVKQNFTAGGRPKRWPRKRGGESSRLQDTRRLRRSITHKASSHDVEVGTNVRYARLHHFGGTVKPKKSRFLAIPLSNRRELQLGARAFIRRHRGDVFFTFKSGGRGAIMLRREGQRAEPVFALRKKVEVPARPFLLAHPEDRLRFQSILDEHLTRGLA